MTEPIEHIESPSDEDIQSFIDGPDAPDFHPILEVWQKVLEPAAGQAEVKVSPVYANRVIRSYPEIEYADMNDVRDSYFEKILQLADILDIEIASDAECLKVTEPSEDAEQNRHHYLNVILQWHLAVLQWELEWETTDPNAAVEIAAIGEVQKMFFGEQGLLPYLESIGFQYTEDDQDMVRDALDALRAEYEGAQ